MKNSSPISQVITKTERITIQKKKKRLPLRRELYTIIYPSFVITAFNFWRGKLKRKRRNQYNRVIGHYNLLINLYNQARRAEKDFRKLLPFKTLYKQIGCGEKKALFHELKYDTREQQQAAKENTNETLNLKDTLGAISEAGEKYLGPGYRELGEQGSGVFRSADDTRQFRIDESSLNGAHKPWEPHGQFEKIQNNEAQTINHVIYED